MNACLPEKDRSAPIVAKFGGTSMARPDLVAAQLNDSGQDLPDVVVVSAPGVDNAHSLKVTDMLLGVRNQQITPQEIQARFADLLDEYLDGGTKDSRRVVDGIPRHIDNWLNHEAAALEGLGEYLAATILASEIEREFVHPSDIVKFDNHGVVDKHLTFEASRNNLGGRRKYVIPGFIGSMPNGKLRLLARGGSDITGALVARGLGARRYDNWSDVPGFMSANPRKVQDVFLLPEITYREARELSNGGSELLHRDVIRYLGGAGISTCMRNTFGSIGNIGTTISDSRDLANNPLVAVTGRDNMLRLTVHELGLNERSGGTTDIFEALEQSDIPYEHMATATDDIALFIPDFERHIDEVITVAGTIDSPRRLLDISKVGMLHIVGEGLAVSGQYRMRCLGKLAAMLGGNNIESFGATDVGGSATLTIFIESAATGRAIQLAHDELVLA